MFGVHTEWYSVWYAHRHLSGYMDETAELLLSHVNWFSVCDVRSGQVFTGSICITKAYEVVSCGQTYAVCSCE